MSVFVGGCTLEAVEAVCNAPDLAVGDTPSIDVLEAVTSLVDKSMLRNEVAQGGGADGEPRVIMLDTIREYALDLLKTNQAEVEQLRLLHTNYYLALAEESMPGFMSKEQVEWLNRLEAEHGNVRAAQAWSLEQEDAELALRLARALWWSRNTRGDFR